jgi:hypothetical protein
MSDVRSRWKKLRGDGVAVKVAATFAGISSERGRPAAKVANLSGSSLRSGFDVVGCGWPASRTRNGRQMTGIAPVKTPSFVFLGSEIGVILSFVLLLLKE